MSTVFTQRLAPPPALEEGTLRIVPLGGLGDVGRNMTVLEYGGRLLVVDCGVLFPEESQPGVDLILPDFDLIADRLEDVEAIVLTHGHEDHIGAVPYLLRQKPDIPLVDRKSTRLNSSHVSISYAVFCLKKKKNTKNDTIIHVSVGICV